MTEKVCKATLICQHLQLMLQKRGNPIKTGRQSAEASGQIWWKAQPKDPGAQS